MKVIAEVGSCYLNGRYPLADAIRAAFDCGADLAKIQYFSNGKRLAMRRGGAKGLEQWNMTLGELADLVNMFPQRLGVSVFSPEDASDIRRARVTYPGIERLAFVKTATQEYQWAVLAEEASGISSAFSIPLYVSVPRDGCLVMGNYWSPLPITWLYCEPKYPANAMRDYWVLRIGEMRERLPGDIGLSDHTPDAELVKTAIQQGSIWGGLPCAVEKHFCFDEGLRDKVPDGGPWSLSREDFAEYAKVAKGA